MAVSSMRLYVCVSEAIMREQPLDAAAGIMRLLFAEQVAISNPKETWVSDSQDAWIKVAIPDRYVGWMLLKELTARMEDYPIDVRVSRLKANIYGGPNIIHPPIMELPRGSGLKVLDAVDPMWLRIALLDDQEGYIRRIDVTSTSTHYYVCVPVTIMMKEPSHVAEVVSEALFAEPVIIREKQDHWVKIVTGDEYVGWMLLKDLIGRGEVYETDVKVSRLRAHIYGVPDTVYKPIMTLPYGSGLKVLEATDPRWLKVALLDDQECYIQRGDVTAEPAVLDKQQLLEFSKRFLDLPYTWGGRSSFGYDCSGFVQMLYGRMGMHLQRDAKQQVRDPRFREIPLDALQPCDLVFFGFKESEIRHVGMSLGDGLFIHATARENMPWIRISKLSDVEWSGALEVYYPYRTARQLIASKEV